MEQNPYQSPRELGTRPVPVPYDADAKTYAALMVVFGVIGVFGGLFFSVIRDETWAFIAITTSTALPLAVFGAMLHRNRRTAPTFFLSALSAFLALLTSVCLAGALYAVFYLGIKL